MVKMAYWYLVFFVYLVICLFVPCNLREIRYQINHGGRQTSLWGSQCFLEHGMVSLGEYMYMLVQAVMGSGRRGSFLMIFYGSKCTNWTFQKNVCINYLKATLSLFLGVFTSCMLNIFGVVIFLRTGWVVVCVFLFIYMCIFFSDAGSWYSYKSFGLSLKWSDLKGFAVFAVVFLNEQLYKEGERFCEASLLFFYYFIYINFVSCFNVR